MHTALHEELPGVLTAQELQPASCQANCISGRAHLLKKQRQLLVQASGAAKSPLDFLLPGLTAFYHPAWRRRF